MSGGIPEEGAELFVAVMEQMASDRDSTQRRLDAHREALEVEVKALRFEVAELREFKWTFTHLLTMVNEYDRGQA